MSKLTGIRKCNEINNSIPLSKKPKLEENNFIKSTSPIHTLINNSSASDDNCKIISHNITTNANLSHNNNIIINRGKYVTGLDEKAKHERRKKQNREAQRRSRQRRQEMLSKVGKYEAEIERLKKELMECKSLIKQKDNIINNLTLKNASLGIQLSSNTIKNEYLPINMIPTNGNMLYMNPSIYNLQNISRQLHTNTNTIHYIPTTTTISMLNTNNI